MKTTEHEKQYQDFIRSEITMLEEMLDDIPKDRIIQRLGMEHRLDCARLEMNSIPTTEQIDQLGLVKLELWVTVAERYRIMSQYYRQLHLRNQK